VSTPGEQRPQSDEGGRPYPSPPPYPDPQNPNAQNPNADPRYPDPPYPAGPQPSQPSGTSPYGATPHDTPPHDTRPYGTPGDPPYVYNPYAQLSYPTSYPAPAGLGTDQGVGRPVRRPGSLHLALVLLVLSALPYLLFGLVATLVADSAAAALPADDLAQLQAMGIDVAQVVRTVGLVMLAVAAVFVLLAVLAWSGRRWARALAAAMVVGFVLMVVASVLAAGAQGVGVDPASLLVLGVPVALALVGVALMFGSGAREWFSRPRR
jgi:hypothetical protein